MKLTAMEKYAGVINVEGMTCGSCVKTIESNVGAIPGVLSVQVELPDKEASVVVDPTVVTINSIVEKINNMGFVATQKKPPKDKTSEGCPSPDSPGHGATGHQADLASIFSGSRAGDLERGKRPTARKPNAANGLVSSRMGADANNVPEQGHLAEKPEKVKQKRRALNTKPASLTPQDLHPVVERKITTVVSDVETSSSAKTLLCLKGKRPTARKPKAGNEVVSSQMGADANNLPEQGQLAEKPEKVKQKKRALNTKPASLSSPDLHHVVERKITTVVFDVETSGSAKTDEVIQLSATTKSHGSFNAYILPLAGISFSASRVHMITEVGGRLFHGKTQVPAMKKEEAWREFIRFCENISPVLLVGHNVTFDARFTINELARLNLIENFTKVVAGFSDTLPLLRGTLPHLASHTQASVVSEVMGTDYTYESHNSQADVAALMDVLQKLKVSDEKLIKFSFTASSFVQHLKNLEEERIMEIIYSPRRVTRPTLKILAMAGYTLNKLQRLAKSKNQDDFISTLLPVLPKKNTSVDLYETLLEL